MNKTYALLAAVATIAFAAPAFSADDKSTSTFKTEVKTEQSDKGTTFKEQTKKETETAAGTTTAEATVKAEADAKGNTEKTTETKISEDPKGLFNKSTTKTKDKVAHKDGKTTIDHKKVVNGKTVEDTSKEIAPAAGASAGASTDTKASGTTSSY